MENWIHVNKNGGSNDDSVKITVDANTTSSERTGEIVIKGESSNKSISIKCVQAGAVFHLPTYENVELPHTDDDPSSGAESSNGGTWVCQVGSDDASNFNAKLHMSNYKYSTGSVIVDGKTIFDDNVSQYSSFNGTYDIGSVKNGQLITIQTSFISNDSDPAIQMYLELSNSAGTTMTQSVDFHFTKDEMYG